MGLIDLTTYRLRVVECASCHQPVAHPRKSEPGAAPNPCPYCGASAPPRVGRVAADPGTSPYRGKPRGPDGKLLPFELARPPRGLERYALGARRRELPKLREAWEEAKAQLEAEHDAHTEFRAAWLAAILSGIFAASGDPLRERAVLETAFEALTLPIYRAMVAARLSRLALRAKALELAEDWLRAAPSRTYLPEADSDLVVARALLARARGDDEGVFDLIGSNPDASSITGGARVMADLLRVDLLERRGDPADAAHLHREAVAMHGARVTSTIAKQFGLAPKTTHRVKAVRLTVMGALATVVASVAWLLTAQ